MSGATYLDAARIPGGRHVVDYDRCPARVLNVTPLLPRCESTDVDAVRIGVVSESHGDDVRLTVGSDGGQPAEALAVKAGDLLVGDDAHG